MRLISAVPRFLRLQVLWLLPGLAAVVSGQTFDVLIHHGRVIDGMNAPWRQADVGIRGDRIVAVDRLPAATAREVIDAADRFVVPRFIDAHSHAFPALARDRTAPAQALLRQGITTVLINSDSATTRSPAADSSNRWMRPSRSSVEGSAHVGAGGARACARAALNDSSFGSTT